MKKKVSLFVFASFFSLILLSSLVLAAVPISLLAPNLPMASPGDLLKSVIQWIAQTAGWVLGGADLGDVIFSKLLLFILLVAVLYPAAKKIPAISENTAASMIVAVIVSVLGLQFITQDIIKAVLLPYGTLAIAVATMIPLFLYAYFVEGIQIGWIRKVAWCLALATFLGLWTIRYYELGVIATYFYGAAALMCGILLVFDGTVRRAVVRSKISRGTEIGLNDQLVLAQSEVLAAEEVVRRNPTSEAVQMLGRKQRTVRALLKLIGKK
jgi:hypothetical protein